VKVLPAPGSQAPVILVKKGGKWVPGPGWDDWPPDPDMELARQAEAFDGKRG
jgi:hypothetical protein